jgi:hypothetical protein
MKMPCDHLGSSASCSPASHANENRESAEFVLPSFLHDTLALSEQHSYRRMQDRRKKLRLWRWRALRRKLRWLNSVAIRRYDVRRKCGLALLNHAIHRYGISVVRYLVGSFSQKRIHPKSPVVCDILYMGQCMLSDDC